MKHTGQIHAPTIAFALYKLTEAYEIINDEADRIRYGYTKIPDRVKHNVEGLNSINKSLDEEMRKLRSFIQTPDEQRY